jgi:hypothetical protein
VAQGFNEYIVQNWYTKFVIGGTNFFSNLNTLPNKIFNAGGLSVTLHICHKEYVGKFINRSYYVPPNITSLRKKLYDGKLENGLHPLYITEMKNRCITERRKCSKQTKNIFV